MQTLTGARGTVGGGPPHRWPQNLRFLRRQPLVCCWLPKRRATCGSKSTTQSVASEETPGFAGETSKGRCRRELGLSAAGSLAPVESAGGDCWSPSPARGVPASAPATRVHVSPAWPPSGASHGQGEEGTAESIPSYSSPPVLGPWGEAPVCRQGGQHPATHSPGSRTCLGAMAQSTLLSLQGLWALAEVQRAQAGMCAASWGMTTAS